ncbi:trypsin-like peptidase domain-containing protein [Streptomyces sp. NPDC001941]|uniref:VMAP-C domain-containing protein n=1 Tax=Streptomyces sp. NPDC001941 TaxID=3154659 RepID=UPI003331A079
MWFRGPALPAARVAVLYEGDRKAAGGGALLSSRTVLTCAHVVNDVLRRDQLAQERPDGAEVSLLVSGECGRERVPARLVAWVAPRPRAGDPVWGGDLAVLELERPVAAGTAPVVWRDMAEGQGLRAWHGGGLDVTFADTEVAGLTGAVGYLDAGLKGAAIGPGYSGGPLWARDDWGAVGLVVAHVMPRAGAGLGGQDTVRRSWGIPWQVIREELAAVGAAEVVAACSVREPVGADAPEVRELADWVRVVCGDRQRRAEHAAELARELGIAAPRDGSAPSVEELTRVLVGRERALAALSALLAPELKGDRAELDGLLAAGRAVGARLLSRGEFGELTGLLAAVAEADASLVPRAARASLPYTPLPDALRGARLACRQVDSVVVELEPFTDPGASAEGAAPMPALLTLVAYAAAGAAEPQRAALRAWLRRLAARLGVHREALAQRERDAAQWALHRPPPVERLVVRIAAVGPAPSSAYRCAVWQVGADGTPEPLARADGALGAEQVAALVQECAGRARGPGGGVDRVDVVVDREGLRLPFDDWAAGSGLLDFLRPAPLGVRFRIALRCPEMSERVPGREDDMRRRWDGGAHGPLVVAEGASPEKVAALLQSEYRDARQAVLHGPPELRHQLLQVCLALGVPVVLWDREARTHAHAERLDKLSPCGTLHQLMDRIRDFRAELYGEPEYSAARPSLVWEDTDVPLPRDVLDLRDPSEGTYTS